MSQELNRQIAQGYTPTIDVEGAAVNALRRAYIAQEFTDQPEKMQMLREERGWKREDRLREMEMRPMKDQREALEYLRMVAPMVTWPLYPQSRDWLISKNRINPSILPEPTHFEKLSEQTGKPPEEMFEGWKRKSLTSLDDQLRQELGLARIESSEKMTGMKIDAASQLGQARLDAMGQRQDDRFKQQEEMQNLVAL